MHIFHMQILTLISVDSDWNIWQWLKPNICLSIVIFPYQWQYIYKQQMSKIMAIIVLLFLHECIVETFCIQIDFEYENFYMNKKMMKIFQSSPISSRQNGWSALLKYMPFKRFIIIECNSICVSFFAANNLIFIVNINISMSVIYKHFF
jgi:hypothetical protein